MARDLGKTEQGQETAGAASQGALHAIKAGQPEPVGVWLHLNAIRSWLGTARAACHKPPAEAEKAAEWLLDNEYQIRRAVAQVEEDMPAQFYCRLPRLAAAEFEGVPRVFIAADCYMDAVHGQIGLASATDFIGSYQDGQSLRIAELWAFPAMLRLICLQAIVAAVSDLFPDLEMPFRMAPAAAAGSERDPTETMSRAIVALGVISRVRWKDFVEASSHAESILRAAPDGLHAAMDFETRDMYRNAVEELADGSGWTETAIASEAVKLCAAQAGSRRRAHAGWWLIGGGRRELERRTSFRPKAAAVLKRFALVYAESAFLLVLLVFTLLALAPPVLLMRASGAGPAALAAVTVLSVIPASIIGVTLTNWIITLTVPPRILPKMDFEKGLPEGYESAIIVPVIFRTRNETAPLLRQLERHWLTNPDPRLRIVLLSDLGDAEQAVMPGDAGIEAALKSGIAALNAKYAPESPFVLMHRRRRWNPSEGVFMCWERKRGKIEEFNEYLLGAGRDAFPVSEGDTGSLRKIRFVTTLDADTMAPPGTVRRMIGTLAHPLNRPGFDQSASRVTAGYSIIQPRIEISPAAGAASIFARLYTGDTAIDIYSRAVSDVYQDLFGEGIFTGKGTYDVAAFHRSLKGRVPENALTSHDLFEGLHGRTGLASDIVLYESFPARYPEYARRLHRWVRGDWQLLPWLKASPPGHGGQRVRSHFSQIDRWKIIDNLRRSLVAPSLVLLAVCAWLAMPRAAPVWTLLIAAAPGSYLFTDLVMGLSRGRRRGTVRHRTRRFADHAGRWALEVAFMAQGALVSLDAVLRTLWRLFVTRRRMLEWVTAAHAAARGSDRRAGYWAAMAGAPVLAASITGILTVLAPQALPGALPLLVVWLLSPEIAQLIGRPLPRRQERLSDDDRCYLKGIARRTWLFFETFSGPKDNWLPPDNYQTGTHEEIAHRTSPTNVGMQFLSSLTALDLGHAGLCEINTRTQQALSALGRMDRHRGHFLNWIDTQTLAPLEPRYISTVDSGNLAVSLITLEEGLREASGGPAISLAIWSGLGDTMTLLRQAVMGLQGGLRTPLLARMDNLLHTAAAVCDRPSAWQETAVRLHEEELPALAAEILEALNASPETDSRELHLWLERCQHHVGSLVRDLSVYFPWLEMLSAPPEGAEALAAELSELLPADMPLSRAEDLAKAGRTAIGPAPACRWRSGLLAAIGQGIKAQMDLRQSLLDNAGKCADFAEAMDFGFLYDRETSTFFIGYNLSQDRMDEHRYDLLASEARLASYFAIAKGDVPAEHWFSLGRPMSREGGALRALSWNGSMFEYLMPALLIRSEQDQLLGQSEAAAVDVQIRCGGKLRLPWGVSEAAFAARDARQAYQYSAFGVAGLGMKQGLAEDYVVAPYASALALAVKPHTATANLRRLDAMGLLGRYGFYDAVDFTPARIPEGRKYTPVRVFMAHHQGMLLAAIDNILMGDLLPKRFNRNPRIAAVDLILHERIPWEYVPEPLPDPGLEPLEKQRRSVPKLHGWRPPAGETPQLHSFGNTRLSIWIDDAARSSVWWHGQSITRWAGDPSAPAGNARLYLRDAETGEVFGFGRGATQDPDVTFYPEKAAFHARHGGIAASLEMSVAAADDVAIQRVGLVNHSDKSREIEVTFFSEPVLWPNAAHERHPAFSKLFIKSELLPGTKPLAFIRRPRKPGDQPPVLLQQLVIEDPSVQAAGYETDRRVFLGRHGDPARPEGLRRDLTETAGWTLDPAAVMRARVVLRPWGTASFAFVTVVAGSLESAVEIARRYNGMAALDWVREDAERAAAVAAAALGTGQSEIEDAQALCRRLVLPPVKPADTLRGELPGQADLWSLGLSGDHPVILVRLANPDSDGLLPTVIRAHHWWRRNGLSSDLVILGLSASSYDEPVSASVRGILRNAGLDERLGGAGGVHLQSIDRISPRQRHALETLSRIVLDGQPETLPAALPPRPEAHAKPPFFEAAAPWRQHTVKPVPRPDGLLFGNGTGGFSADGKTYVIHLASGQRTPVPWCNVIANENFGCIVSEAGLGFTWSLNSGEYRLTPWPNDPVSDPQGEALYLRDEETAEIWTTTPLPAGDVEPCRIDHGAGTTEWRRNSKGLEQRLTVLVPADAPVKAVRLMLRNPGSEPRRVTATYYAEWQLGGLYSPSHAHVSCGYDTDAQALTARNGWSSEFAGRVSFLASSHPPHALSYDRSSFLGTGDTSRPEALTRWDLGSLPSHVSDPCAAFQVHLDLPPGGKTEAVFILGDAASREEMRKLAEEWTAPGRFEEAEQENSRVWDKRLGAVQVKTADPAFDLMVNRWLPYQAFASRILARAGYSQAAGGVGFRDQLQDMMAFLISDPSRVRSHILDCAAKQFEEGDVLHWWHPPLGRGVRTRCSDDMLWLVYATHRYVSATGDAAILDANVPFLTAPELAEDEDDRYAAFETSWEARPLYDHCRRALERGLTEGQHGLPLMGGGDWNDGMDRIGRQGRGESVWLAWFGSVCADAFAGLCTRKGDDTQAQKWHACSAALRRAADSAGWDGAWYKRAFDDDGEPWGSAGNEECRIDSIAQSWAVLAGAPDKARARKAVQSAAARLVDRELRLVRLLAPPFENTPRDPGYIRAYPPGVRENGGQYTHAATWLGLAFAGLGDARAAREIFDLINPVLRTATAPEAALYRGEPYVMAADVYGVPPFEGRAGWTWYTGAAAWAWRLAVEGILGLELCNGRLRVAPCLPQDHSGIKAEVKGPRGTIALTLAPAGASETGSGLQDGAPAAGFTEVEFPEDGSVLAVHIAAGGQSGAATETS
ncbi:GH36-type glycosyl hydrolase domain-containing protein [Leisingera sp. D0M16]|uniref:GH36-type glycosyl hydrolase domain-containing protein n=1 Tax=Leisingera coralii TaxID=3351347 RepID=UPI003B79C6A4